MKSLFFNTVSIVKKLLAASLLLYSLSGVYQLWISSQNIGDRGTQALDRWEADMLLVREEIPISRGVVGYISEENVSGAEYAYWDNETEFLLSQYELAPLILKKGLAAEWNLVILSDLDLQTWMKENPGQYEITHIKSNIYVLQNLGAK